MRLLRSISLGIGVLTAGTLAALAVGGQSTPGLPGGATSLRETYGDWIVTCSVRQSRKTCAMQQELTAQQTHRLPAEMTPTVRERR